MRRDIEITHFRQCRNQMTFPPLVTYLYKKASGSLTDRSPTIAEKLNYNSQMRYEALYRGTLATTYILDDRNSNFANTSRFKKARNNYFPDLCETKRCKALRGVEWNYGITYFRVP